MTTHKNWFTRYGKINLILILISLSVIIVFAGGVLKEKTREGLTLLHCTNINKDVTRPEGRYCDRVISLNDDTLVFVTADGELERYEVIEIDSKEGIEYIYNFKDIVSEGS